MKFDIIIIGAGAAGLVTALQTATLQPQLNILVIEKEAYPGRKLNASGNGKCNLTNAAFSLQCYHSDDLPELEAWVNKHTYTDMISFFESIGILLYEKNGYYYPVSNQAKQVTKILHEKGKMAGVSYLFENRVTKIEKVSGNKQQGYSIYCKDKNGKHTSFTSSYVVLATGGCASPRLGGSKDGYAFAKDLSLKCNDIYPVLSPVYVKDDNLSVAKGVRIDAKVTLKLPDGQTVQETGQIQFNEDNLSGIVMMNLSCILNQLHINEETDCLHIDVLPEYTWEQLKQFIATQQKRFPEITVESLLNGILPGAFVRYILKHLNIKGEMLSGQLSEKQMNRLTSNLKKLCFTTIYKEDYDKAQVTGGGISLKEMNLSTFESNKHSRLYVVGELLDVNGICGGYNLTFAMLSGMEAAESIVESYHA